jgi:hypothetical protein
MKSCINIFLCRYSLHQKYKVKPCKDKGTQVNKYFLIWYISKEKQKTHLPNIIVYTVTTNLNNIINEITCLTNKSNVQMRQASINRFCAAKKHRPLEMKKNNQMHIAMHRKKSISTISTMVFSWPYVRQWYYPSLVSGSVGEAEGDIGDNAVRMVSRRRGPVGRQKSETWTSPLVLQ